MSHSQTLPSRQTIGRLDLLVLTFLWLGYLCLLLFRIGYLEYPTHGYTIQERPATMDIELGQRRTLDRLNVYDGEGDGEVTLEYWNDGWRPVFPALKGQLKLESFYKVLERPLPQPVETSRLRLKFKGEGAVINELALFDSDRQRIVPSQVKREGESESLSIQGDRHPLFDEAKLTRFHNDYRGNTYFDEIYHGRTAYEFVHHLPPYENTHPPLGKFLISLGIRMLDMTPFGMRLTGALFGSLLPVLLFWGGLLVTGSRTGAWLASLLTACDFMNFTISRFATIDVFQVFFLTAFALSLYRWYLFEKASWQWPSLGWFYGAGLFLGLAASVKWSALFVGTGIGLLYLWQLHEVWRSQGNLRWSGAANLTGHYFLAFIVVPLLVYYLSYGAFFPCLPEHPSLFSSQGVREFLAQQRNMFSYHSELVATHPFSSPFYTWPFIYKPLYLYVDPGSELHVAISLMGNPVLWWSGLVGMVIILWIALGGKNPTATFLAGGYLVLFLPWMLVNRLTFIYHYFPTLPFLFMGLAWLLTRLPGHWPAGRVIQGAFLVAAVLAFIAFYPAISGYPVAREYVQWLHWFENWNIL